MTLNAARRSSSRLRFALAFLLLPAGLLAQEKKDFTIDDLFDPAKRVDLTGTAPSGLVWLSDTHYLWAKTDPKTRSSDLLKVEASSGKTVPFFDAARMEAALAKIPGTTRDEAKRLAHQRTYPMNEKRTTAILSVANDLYAYTFGAEGTLRLTFTPEAEEEASFSPDGSLVAFVRGNNLFLVDLASQRERALTTDGGAEILNGKLDWVYQEEVYGRGTYRAYWWSPDSSRLAFLRLDEHGVPRYTLVDDIPTRPEVESWPYPKAGDPNPKIQLLVARVAGGTPTLVDTGKYSLADHLIVDVTWAPGSDKVAFQVQDREQTWLDLNLAAPNDGKLVTLFRETTEAWVDNQGSPRWLKDGSFLWFSERSGFKHLYHYKADGTLIRALTSGEWEARVFHGVDEATGYAYFSGTERSAIGSDVYRIKLDGSGLTRLSATPGTHTATFNPGLSHYLDSWSDIKTPTLVRLHKADGTEVRIIDANPIAALGNYRLGQPEFVQVKTRDGFVMEAALIKPPDFDPAKKYPVFQQTYAGPHAPSVRNSWGGVSGLFYHLLAQRGIVVWICDNRSASGKGARSAWASYRRLGESELADIEDGLAWLKAQPWVDASRIGINGWSYGGFMVSYALTHSKSFAMGIAGGSVTDWRNYDSIYTERYMRTPQNNPEGYSKTAPRAAAKNLHGKLFLIHGALDDNVHPQNTMQFAHELEREGKPFRLMIYPKSRHGVSDPLLVKHLRQAMLDFIEDTLLRK